MGAYPRTTPLPIDTLYPSPLVSPPLSRRRSWALQAGLIPTINQEILSGWINKCLDALREEGVPVEHGLASL